LKIIVDTCIWSLAFRKKSFTADPTVMLLQELIKESRVQMLGPIRQEILSGIKLDKDFEKLSTALRSFQDFNLISEDYEHAARLFNLCRRNGIQGSNTDFLICSISERYDMAIFTYDIDFKRYQKYFKINLIDVSTGKPVPSYHA
jgi:hypothetical protein